MVQLLWKNGSTNQTLIALLENCRSMSEFKQIQAFFITSGLSQHHPFASRLLSFSAISSWGDIDHSYRIFLQIPSPTISNWNSIIRGFSKGKNPNPSVSIFVKMLRFGVCPDHLTYPFVAKAVARLSELRLALAVHCRIAKEGLWFDRFIANSLIHMYGSCGDIGSARKVFDEMLIRNSVSWNAMLDGYAKCGDLDSAHQVFESMPDRDVVSWSSMIDGCVKGGEYGVALAILRECGWWGLRRMREAMHQYMVDNTMWFTLVLRTSLMDMYAKCGAIEEAIAVFRGVPMDQTDVLMWNTIIGGLATHGLVRESLELFKEMQVLGIVPDEITYLCLLSACAHGSLGKQGMVPKSEHYACMVDVLSRAGRLAEAYDFIAQMPMEPTASMLGALLNGCMNHRRFDLAERVGRKLIELEPDHDGRYIGLSNVYAGVKLWDNARIMREAMERRGFIAHDKTHNDSEKIYMMLNTIVRQMMVDVDFETQERGFYDIEV
ncbi:hypothetical protein AAG906_019939 [Vitis piasezkii]